MVNGELLRGIFNHQRLFIWGRLGGDAVLVCLHYYANLAVRDWGWKSLCKTAVFATMSVSEAATSHIRH